MTDLAKEVTFATIAGLAVCQMGAGELPTLSLQEAHEMALRNHPLISVAALTALASQQVVTQARSGFFPNISLNSVSVGTAAENTRLSAIGALNNPAIFDRNAEGVLISQLITDFGRTANLTASAKSQARAAANDAQATREQILLAVDSAFYSAQQAQAVTKVAQQTVSARQVFLEQVSELARNSLKSELDVSFAKVNVEDAQLLLVKAQNDLEASFAQLSDLLGLRETKRFSLRESALPAPLSTNVYDFVQQALQLRPDIVSLRDQQEAASKLARAERDARLPAISAVGSAGVAPIHDAALSDTYAAAGLIVNLPIFAGGLYTARQKEAELQAQAAQEKLRNLENNVIRDVRITWLNSQNALDRHQISGRLLDNAKQSFDLVQARYKNALSSIVEVNQAELNLISAQIAFANTLYEYLVQRSALSFQTGTLR
jgi:outer membrane protein